MKYITLELSQINGTVDVKIVRKTWEYEVN